MMPARERSRPAVSVVMPVRDRESIVSRAIASVVAQTSHDWELVVVDDASEDGTRTTVARWARRDPRIWLLPSPTPGGAQVARNLGISAANGDWVSFLDSDDEWVPRSLELRLAVAASRDVDVVHSDCFVATEATRRPMGVPRLEGDVHVDLLRHPGPLFPSLLVRRSVMTRLGPLDPSLVSYQEWDTAIRLARLARFGFADEPTFVYWRDQARTISGDSRSGARGYEQVVTKHRLDIHRLAGRRWLARHYRAIARLRTQTMGHRAAVGWYLRAAWHRGMAELEDRNR